MRTEAPAFAYLFLGSLDGDLHREGTDSPAAERKLQWYEQEIRRLFQLAEDLYEDVRLNVFSDHGMCTVEHVVDLMPKIDALGLEYGEDYVGIYDSTMLRFWFLKPGVEDRIRAGLPDADHGRWITELEHRRYGTYWEDGRFGDAVYALNPSYLLNPSHMGNVPLKGMHGYRPEHEDSDSALLANFEPETKIEEITDYYSLMVEMAEWAYPAAAHTASRTRAVS